MRGGAGLPAAIMLQSGPWFSALSTSALSVSAFSILALWISDRSPSALWIFAPWVPAVLVAVCAGVLDWRFRRIPNWLTVSGLVAGIVVNTALYRWPGLKAALLGALLGLGLLLPFVLIRSLGAGDWKLAGALGACLGPRELLSVLVGTILVAGVMALAVVIWKGRLKRTLVNIAHMLAALFRLRMPGHEVSLDDPQSTKIPFGVAMAVTVLVYGVGRATGNL
jgi:prepilin peptidase CpaA